MKIKALKKFAYGFPAKQFKTIYAEEGQILDLPEDEAREICAAEGYAVQLEGIKPKPTKETIAEENKEINPILENKEEKKAKKK